VAQLSHYPGRLDRKMLNLDCENRFSPVVPPGTPILLRSRRRYSILKRSLAELNDRRI